MTTARVADAAPPLSLPAVLSLCLIAPVGGIALAGMSPVMPMIGAEFAKVANAEVLVRLMMSGASAAMILGALLSGVLSERLGQVRLLVWALIIYGLAGAAIFLLDNLYAMVAFRLVQGVAIAAGGVLAMALITTRIAPEKRDKWLGFYMVTGTVGIVMLFSAIGAIAAIGWRYTFLLFLLAVPLAVLLALVLPDKSNAHGGASAGAGDTVSVKPPIPWGLAAFGVLCGAVAMASSMFLPYHLAELGLGDPGTIAMMMVGGAGASGVATLCFGLVRSKLSALQIFIIGFVLNGVGSLLIAFATGPIVLLAGMVLGGVGLGLVMPNVFSACAAATQPQWRARMLGFVRAGFNAGPLMAQPVLEVVYRQSNAGMTLAAIGLASFGGVVWVLLTRRQFDPYE
jgi:MFS family permease